MGLFVYVFLLLVFMVSIMYACSDSLPCYLLILLPMEDTEGRKEGEEEREEEGRRFGGGHAWRMAFDLFAFLAIGQAVAGF